MYRTGHYGAALIVYAPAGAITLGAGYPKLALVGGVIAVWWAKLPDIDRTVPFVDHRGVTHTVWFALLAGAILGGLGGLLGLNQGMVATVGLATFGAAVGIVTIGSHILADALTPMGVRPFMPVSDREYALGLTTAANPLANVALLVLGIVATGLAIVGGNALADLLG